MNLVKSKMLIAMVAFAMVASLSLLASPQQASASIVSGSKFLGNIISGSVPSDFGTYWNQVTPENATKWGSVEYTRDAMNWSGADTAYNYANSNGFPFKFHTLVWGAQQPDWISSLSPAEQRAEVTEWIQAAGQRYGDADYVDVVNEPLHQQPSYKNAIGGDGSTGWDWVIWSFQQARQAFPNSELLLNDYGIIGDPNAAQQYIQIINLLNERGLIDGIGIQCHAFNMNTVSVSTMNTVLNDLAATGLPIYVSELDIQGDDATQLQRYQEKFPVLWEHPAVKGVTLWGYIEGQTWIDDSHLVTSSGAERPALTWLKQYLGGGETSPIQSGSVYKLRNAHSGKVLGIENMSASDGAYAVQWDDNGTADHEWRIDRLSNGYYKLTNIHSGKVLGIEYMSTENGANAIQWEDSGTADHEWEIAPVGDGSYKLVNRHSGKVLGIENMSTENGANAVQWDDNGTADHNWYFEFVR